MGARRGRAVATRLPVKIRSATVFANPVAGKDNHRILSPLGNPDPLCGKIKLTSRDYSGEVQAVVEDPENAWTADFCLRPYNPYKFGGSKNPSFNPADGRLLELKDNTDSGVEAAAEDFSQGLEKLGLPKRTILMVVPGHEGKNSNKGGALARVAEVLANTDTRYVASVDSLIRTKTVPKKAGGGDRDFQTEIESMTVTNADDLKGATVVVLDDTVTTGTSLAAARHLLNQAGAKRVAAVARLGLRGPRRRLGEFSVSRD